MFGYSEGWFAHSSKAHFIEQVLATANINKGEILCVYVRICWSVFWPLVPTKIRQLKVCPFLVHKIMEICS